MRLRNINALLIITLCLLVSACDSLNTNQLLVRPNNLNSDIESVKEILIITGKNRGFIDKTGTSQVPDTIVFLVGPEPHFPIYLGARVVNSEIIIDISHFHPGSGETQKYKEIKNEIYAKLDNLYSDNVKILSNDEYVPLNNKNP